MRLAAIIFVFAAFSRAACVAVAGDRITAADLAPAVPIFQTIDGAIPLGFAPLPGTQRILSNRELVLLAQKNGLKLEGLTSGVCVERIMKPIVRADLQAALIGALGVPDAELEIVEFSSQPVPPGQLEFQRSGLAPPSPANALAMWRGRLRYDGQHSVGIWAKVKVTVSARQFVAAEDIAAGTVIREDQIKETEARQFPFAEPAPAAIADIAGKVTRRRIAAGERIVSRALDVPKEVHSGEMVHVKVIDGTAVLSFDGVAEGAGRAGDSVWVHNPTSGKNFKAVVDGKGRVVVRPSSGD